MAKTYTAAATGIAFASGKSMLALFNAHATRKVKIYRIWMLNNQTAAVTGVITTMAIRKITSLASGTAVTPVAHDTGNTSVDLTSVTCATNGTVANSADAPLRTFMWSNDEPAVSSATSDELECLPVLNCYWDSTGDTNIEPIVLNQNEGITLTHTGTSAVGITDLFFEFTVS